MIELRKIIQSHWKFWYWLLLYSLLIDFSNILSIGTVVQSVTLVDGEFYSFFDQYKDNLPSPFIDDTPEPNNFENRTKKVAFIYDIDSPLLSHYSDSRDNSFCFLQFQHESRCSTIYLFEIIYLQNCIMLI
jgi:hypothetical protein